jgi:Glycosyltransferase
MPSILPDPFPTVVLEAMAAGRPVIANAHGGSTELVIDGRTGMLVPPGQAEAMAAAIISMIDQPARAQEMGHEGRRRIEQQFSLERFITRWSQIYADLGAPASEVLTV